MNGPLAGRINDWSYWMLCRETATCRQDFLVPTARLRLVQFFVQRDVYVITPRRSVKDWRHELIQKNRDN